MDLTEQFLNVLQGQAKATESLSEVYKSQNNNSEVISRNIVKSSSGSSFSDNSSKTIGNAEKKNAEIVADIFAKKYVEWLDRSKNEDAIKTQTNPSANISDRGKSSSSNTDSQNLKGKNNIFASLAALMFSKSAWNKVWNSLKNSKMGKSLSKIVTTIKKDVGEWIAKIGNNIKSLFEKVGNSLKLFGTKIMDTIKNIFDSVIKSDFVQGILEKVNSLITSIKEIFSKVVEKITTKISALKDFLTDTISTIAKATGITELFDNLASGIKSTISSIVDKFTNIKDAIKNALKKAIDVLPDGVKKIFSGASKKVSNVASSGASMAKSAISSGGSMLTTAGSKVASGVGKVASGVGKVASGAGKMVVGGSSKVMGKLFKGVATSLKQLGSGGMMTKMMKAKVPIIGPLVETFFTHKDIRTLMKQFDNGEITEEELYDKAGTRALEGITGGLGAGAGATIGAALGSVIPVVGTAIGGVTGGIGGDLLGRKLGNYLIKSMVQPSQINSIGRSAVNLAGGGVMQDFIIKGDNVYPFSNKDEVIGMKTGGAFENIFNSSGIGSSTNGSAETVQTLRDGNKLMVAQIQILSQIAEYTKAFVGQQPQAQQPVLAPMPFNSSTPSAPSPTMSQANNSRGGYGNSAYSH